MIILRKYIVPGLIFQSVVIGGGYATGRELIEFFFPSGPLGGVLGLLTSGVLFSIVLAIAFEFARVCNAYDYRTFCKALLGRGWWLFEIAYFTLLVLILSVIISASGELVADSLGAPRIVGALALAFLIAMLTFMGSSAITAVLAGWSGLLYVVYLLLFILAFSIFGEQIVDAFESSPPENTWFKDGVRYTAYNLAVLPAVLFSIRRLTRRRETIGAGLIAGAVAIIPALLFYTAMMGRYPEIGVQPVPAVFLMAALDIAWLEVIFHIVVFGTFVETGTGLLHAVNERISANYKERGKVLSRHVRPVAALAILAVAVISGSTIGIVDLIARGYGLLTYFFIAILVAPLLTVGLWRITRSARSSHQ